MVFNFSRRRPGWDGKDGGVCSSEAPEFMRNGNEPDSGSQHLKLELLISHVLITETSENGSGVGGPGDASWKEKCKLAISQAAMFWQEFNNYRWCIFSKITSVTLFTFSGIKNHEITPMDSSNEIKALTGLRGIGALWVFLFHLLGSYHVPAIRSGDLAVPMFFVLSGFILFLVHQADFKQPPNRRSLQVFFASRLARVYPLHLFSLLVLLMLVVLLPGFIEQYPSQKFSIPNFFATVFLIQTWGIGHFPVFREASSAWNVPAWSLSAEMFYYALFPWAALVLIKGGK